MGCPTIQQDANLQGGGLRTEALPLMPIFHLPQYFAGLLMPAMAYLEVTQLTEVLFTNGGFIIITVLFLRNMIKESRKDLETLEVI